ncbi:MAG: DNA gyrase subunit A [Sarcina sp.]
MNQKNKQKNKQISSSEKKPTIIKVPISKIIDTQFRDYALYSLEERGIPSFYDALINVQRYILKNCPSKFNKTLTIVGACIADHYHHGDASLGKAVCRMSKPFANSTQLLEGYGFLGTEVCDQPGAPRYTSVRMAQKTKEIISKYEHLNTRKVEGAYEQFWMEVPIGLAMPIVGIAVGYKTTILPRKLEEVSKFLNNKRANLTPYFANFDGVVTKYDRENCWLIKSNLNVDGKNISIKNIPPVLKYNSVLKRLYKTLNNYDGLYNIYVNSSKTVDIKLEYKGSDDSFIDFTNDIGKVFSAIVTESIVFVKDRIVLEYDSIQDYLTDWKWQLARLYMEDSKYKYKYCDGEIAYNKVKLEFIKFIISKKRTVEEIDEFYDKHNKEISERLDRLSSKHFTSSEITKTNGIIKKLEAELIVISNDVKKHTESFEAMHDTTMDRGISSKRMSNALFDETDFQEVDGIIVWSAENDEDDEETSEE